jgi:hypothetical protein
VLWRRGLYGGVLGSAGVSLGWLLWFVMQTAVKVPKVVLLSPLVGAAVGMVYDFFRDYLAAAREDDDGVEAEQEPSPEQGQGKRKKKRQRAAGKATRPLRRRRSSAGKFGAGFLVAIALNVMGDQLSAYLTPFCISVVTFLPAGVVFTMGLTSDASEADLYGRVGRGALVGVLATVASVPMLLLPGIGWQGNGDFAWSYAWGLLGWWTLLGIAYSLFWGSEESPQPLAPMGGAALLVVVMAVLSVVGASLEKQTGNFMLKGLNFLTALALEQPGLPAHAVDDADKLYRASLKEKGASEKQTLAPPQESGWGKALAERFCPPLPDLYVPVQPPQQGAGGMGLPAFKKVPAPPRSATHEALCRELPKGTGSSLFRSWLVLLMFSLGLGVAKIAEARLRPDFYEGSGLERRDRQIFYGVLVTLAGAILYIIW